MSGFSLFYVVKKQDNVHDDVMYASVLFKIIRKNKKSDLQLFPLTAK